MEVDFPSTREDFRRRTGRNFSSQDDDVEESILSGVTSTSSSYEGGGSLLWPSTDDEGRKKKANSNNNKKKHRRKTNQPPSLHRRPTVESSHASSNYEMGAGQMAVDFPTDRTPFFRRCSRDDSVEAGSNNNIPHGDSLNLIFKEGVKEEQSISGGSQQQQQQQRRRRLSHTSSISSNDHRSNESSADALNAFSHRRLSADIINSLQTIHSDISVTQSLREQELRQSLRASIVRRNKSMNNVMGGRQTPDLERKERRPSIDDLLERDLRKSLVEAHNANALALPILGWDVENQSDTSSFWGSSGGREDQSPSKNNDSAGYGGGGLQRSFHSASFESSLRSLVPENHTSIPTTLVSSLNNNSADNPNPSGGFLCEEFVSRGSFQKTNNPHFVDEKNGSRKGSPIEQLIMEEEYDPRKPWRKAPAVAVKCKNNRRASTATFRSSLNSSLNFDPDVLKEFQASLESLKMQQMKENKADEDQHKEQQQQQQKDDGKDKLLRSSHSSRSEQAESDTPAFIAAAANAPVAPVVDEVPRDSPMEDASSSTPPGQRVSKADESTVLSSLAQDDDDSELTELRHAQEALFPIQEGGLKKKNSEGSDMDDSNFRHSEYSDAVSGISFGVEALENSERLVDGGDRKQAYYRNDVSLDIVQEEDEQIVLERILQQKQQQKQQQIEDIIREQEQLQKKQDQKEQLEREQKRKSDEAISRRRLSSDDFGANQIREDLQLDDLPSSAGDIFDKRKIHNDSDTFSDIDIEANPTSSTIRVCLNYTDDSIENEFSTTKLEDVEFGGRESKLYEEEKNLDVSELGLLFEANRNDDILQDDNSSRGSATRTSSKVSSKRTNSTLESAMRPIKKVLKKSASSIDAKTTNNIRRRNKRLWKFCVWNCRKITMCVILLIGIIVAIGVLAWLGAVKNSQIKNTNASGGESTGDKIPVTNAGGNGLEGVEQPSAEGPGFNLQPLENGPTQSPSLSPSLSSSPSSPSIIIYVGPGNPALAPSLVNEFDSTANGSTSKNETELTTGITPSAPVNESYEPSKSPSTPPVEAVHPPIAINVPTVQTEVSGVMRFSEPVPLDTEADLIMFLDALKKSIRSTVAPSLTTNDQLIYVEITSIDGKAVDSLLLRRFLRRWLQTGSSVTYNIVVLTNCDPSGCSDADSVADDIFSRVKNEMTTSVTSGALASALEVNMISSSGGSLEYVTGVELGDFSEPTVTVLSPMEDSSPMGVNSTDETNSTIILNGTSATDSLPEVGNEFLASNGTIALEDNNATSNSILKPDAVGTLPFNATFVGDETLSPYPSNLNSTPGGVANDTLSGFANSTLDGNESLSVVGGNSTTFLFNSSAFNELFSPSSTLDAYETFPAAHLNETSSNSTEEQPTSKPEGSIANMGNLVMDDNTSFNVSVESTVAETRRW
jgi:hypothetical protein